MLDPINSTLGAYYQLPICLPPLDPDPDSNGSPSDHLIVKMTPVNTINNKPARTFREVKVRPLPASGLAKFGEWIQEQDWINILELKSVDEKAEALHNMILNKLEEVCPQKIRKISSDDQCWYTDQLKRLDRKKKREFRRNRRSKRYRKLEKLYNKKIS